MERSARIVTSPLRSSHERKNGEFFLGSVEPRDHLEPKIGLVDDNFYCSKSNSIVYLEKTQNQSG